MPLQAVNYSKYNGIARRGEKQKPYCLSVVFIDKAIIRKAGNVMANFDYRQYYKEFFGIDFDKEYAIHHIDFDRGNNDISNLLLLPIKLHSKYHFLVNNCGGYDGKINFDFKINPQCGHIHTYDYKMMIHLCETMIEIDKWVAKKESMMQSKTIRERYGI